MTPGSNSFNAHRLKGSSSLGGVSNYFPDGGSLWDTSSTPRLA